MNISLNNAATIELNNPNKFNINDENLTFIYCIIAETSPVGMFQIYDLKTYRKKDDDAPEEEEVPEKLSEEESENLPEKEEEEKDEIREKR
jgi:hypothetical protein